jgi:hypothetical protein
MPVHRERVDPIRTPDSELLVHRRWILPDELSRPVDPARLSRLWRGLLELSLLNPDDEVLLERLPLPPPPGALAERQGLPAQASAGALLAGAGAATLLTQMVWLEREERRDPYAEGEDGVGGWRDYTLYMISGDRFLLLPIAAASLGCGACGASSAPELAVFGEASLLDLQRRCPGCGAAADPGRDKVLLRSGALFLLEEACARAALSIELPAAPQAEELPDAATAAAIREAFGDTDELADDQVPAAT